MKKTLITLLCLLLCFACLSCAGPADPDGGPNEPAVEPTVRIAGMAGPTSIGLARLFTDAANGETQLTYNTKILTNDAEIAPLLLTGSLDVAALPANVAAGLFNSSDGAIEVLAINTLGVVSILSTAPGAVMELSDLKGKTLHAAGSGAVPEYALRHLLAKAGVGINAAGENDPGKVTILWEPAGTVQTVLADGVGDDTPVFGMLPQPAATVAVTKGASVALDLDDVWRRLEPDSEWVTGVLVARTQFAEHNRALIATLLKEYEASILYAKNADNLDAVAALATDLGITPSIPVAKRAIPACHLTYIDNVRMKDTLSAFLSALYETDPASVNGALPDDDFYYL